MKKKKRRHGKLIGKRRCAIKIMRRRLLVLSSKTILLPNTELKV